MNHWSFILAAYAITLIGTAAVTWRSFQAMRRAETRADALRKQQ